MRVEIANSESGTDVGLMILEVVSIKRVRIKTEIPTKILSLCTDKVLFSFGCHRMNLGLNAHIID